MREPSAVSNRRSSGTSIQVVSQAFAAQVRALELLVYQHLSEWIRHSHCGSNRAILIQSLKFRRDWWTLQTSIRIPNGNLLEPVSACVHNYFKCGFGTFICLYHIASKARALGYEEVRKVHMLASYD